LKNFSRTAPQIKVSRHTPAQWAQVYWRNTGYWKTEMMKERFATTLGNKPVVKATPRPYQVQALEDIKKTFANHDRATVVIASGTGKTLVSLWAAEQAKAKTVLMLVPTAATDLA
jgi:superfamily II DNA or RNA helicase